MTEHLDQDRLERAEARLRAAVAARVASVHPGGEDAALADVEGRVDAALVGRSRRRRALAVAAAAALVLGVSTFVADDGREQVRTTGSPTTSTTAAPTTTTEAPPRPAPPANAVWPPLDHQRSTDPVGAARSFVEEYLSHEDAPLSAFRATTLSTGEVDVFLVGEGGDVITDRVVSTVSVEEAGGSWWVTGATSEDIVVDEPRPGATVGSPLVVTGRARGYEGNVNVYLVDGGGTPAEPRGHANAIAGSGTDLERFHVELQPTHEQTQPVGSVLIATETAYAVVPVRLVFTTRPVPVGATRGPYDDAG